MASPHPNKPPMPSESPPPLVSKKEITPPPIPSLPISAPSAEENLRDYERAALSLFQQNFNLLLQQVAQWVASQKQQQLEMELTLGKVRAFAELAERIVQTSDSQLEKLVALVTAVIVLHDQMQMEKDQGG